MPDGYNLAFTATAPGVAILFAPVTLLVGAAAAYNIAAVALPALAAWTAYLLCRNLRGRLWPSLVGGLLVWFFELHARPGGRASAHDLGVSPAAHRPSCRSVPRWQPPRTGHRPAAGVDPRSPVLVLTRSVRNSVGGACDSPGGRGHCLPGHSPEASVAVVAITGAYLIAAVLGEPSPLFRSARATDRPLSTCPRTTRATSSTRVIPTGLSAQLVRHWATALVHFTANDAEAGGYLGLPTLVILALFARRRWRTAGGRFLLASVASLRRVVRNGALRGRSPRHVAAVDVAFYTVPFDNVLPARLSLYVSLASSVIVAIWMASSRHRTAALLLPGLAVLAIVPMLGHGYWNTTPVRPSFFTTGLDRSCLRQGESILAIPYNNHGDSMLWQAESNFRFRLAEGYVTVVWPQSYRSSPDVFPHSRAGLVLRPARPERPSPFARSKACRSSSCRNSPIKPDWARYLAAAIRPRRIGRRLPVSDPQVIGATRLPNTAPALVARRSLNVVTRKGPQERRSARRCSG